MGKMNYSAFRRGVAFGFSSPTRFVAGSHWHPSYRMTDTVAAAWSEIGKLLSEELIREGVPQIEQRANKKGGNHKRSRP
jgi:hypothetical protein